MATPTYIALATTTLSTSQNSITFGSIPSTYSDLILVFEGLGTGDGYMRIYPNNDTGNGSSITLSGPGSSQTGSGTFSPLTWGPFNSTTRTQAVLQIMDSSSSKYKTILTSEFESSTQVSLRASTWSNTSPITSLVCQAMTANMGSGTTISLYGIH